MSSPWPIILTKLEQVRESTPRGNWRHVPLKQPGVRTPGFGQVPNAQTSSAIENPVPCTKRCKIHGPPREDLLQGWPRIALNEC